MKKVFTFIFMILLAVVLVFIFIGRGASHDEISKSMATETIPTPAPTIEATPEITPEPTPEPTPSIYTLSFIGDNTLWATSNFENNPIGLPLTVGDDYSYPYKNTVTYFENDEMTFANLECTFSAEKLAYDYTVTLFPFLAKPEYVNILKNGNVDFVTMANNHTLDFYQKGVTSTQEVLNNASIPYGYENDAKIVESKNGLKIGIYTAGNDMMPSKEKAVNSINSLAADGAEIIICMFHWGQELYYTPNENQVSLAHACIDAGADIVYGSHPHCLEPIEEYNDGIIMYSLGNWVFGGNTQPTDPDTAIIQINVKKDVDGSISIDGFNAVPCCISSNIDGGNARANDTSYSAYENYNNYCVTPYSEDNEGYERTLSKLKGTFQAKTQGADYTSYYASWAS